VFCGEVSNKVIKNSSQEGTIICQLFPPLSIYENGNIFEKKIIAASPPPSIYRNGNKF